MKGTESKCVLKMEGEFFLSVDWDWQVSHKVASIKRQEPYTHSWRLPEVSAHWTTPKPPKQVKIKPPNEVSKLVVSKDPGEPTNQEGSSHLWGTLTFREGNWGQRNVAF